MNNLELEKTANEIRKSIVTAVHSAKSGHPGGSLSAADIFTYLYFEELNVDPKNPKDENRDRFVLSKGHVAPALYSTLAEKGFFPKEDLTTLRHTGSYLQGHPDMKHIPGVDMSSGSLGQGVSAAVGMAAAGKFDNKFEAFNFHTIVIDGNNFDEIRAAFKEARETKGQPTAIIAKTIKGKGVSYMENQAGWHGKAPNDEEYKIAMDELEKAGEALCQK